MFKEFFLSYNEIESNLINFETRNYSLIFMFSAIEKKH